MDTRHRIIGGRKRAQCRYAMILYRLGNTHLPKNTCYVGVELRITQEEFITWFQANDFKGCSVDRIDNTKHYEAGNLQLIPLVENIRKDKLKACNGYCECFSCKTTKEITLFAKDKRRVSGYSTICKQCDNSRIKNVSPEAREKRKEDMRLYYIRNKLTKGSTGL